jgi:TetR/AcrR family transcriptional regulator, ethionamide resistance regulator
MATKGDLTRQRILDVVAELMGVLPFDAISIAEITRRAEVTRPAFYFHFPSKGAAVAALLTELFDEFIEAASAWYDHRGGDPVAGVAEGLQGTITLWRTNARLMYGMAQAAATDREAGQLWRDWIEDFTGRAVARLVADVGPTLGEAGPATRAVAELLVGATFDAMQRDVRRIVELGDETPDILETLTYLWTRALRD